MIANWNKQLHIVTYLWHGLDIHKATHLWHYLDIHICKYSVYKGVKIPRSCNWKNKLHMYNSSMAWFGNKFANNQCVHEAHKIPWLPTNWNKKITYKYNIFMMHMIWSSIQYFTYKSFKNLLKNINIQMTKVIKTLVEYEVSLDGLFQDYVMDKF